ncbi:hypothetical protein LA080_011477 [Diaporthe eres]|nr:hypothetical protein LA080_011477 [Diaporthe eres]
MNQSINPVSCVKVIGLYSDDWNGQTAREAVPLVSPIFREVEIQKLSVSFTSSSMAGAGVELTLVDQSGLVDAMVECINEGKNIVFFLPRNALLDCVRRVKESPSRSEQFKFKYISLTSETSMNTRFDDSLDIGDIFQTELPLRTTHGKTMPVVRTWSVIVAIDADAGFTRVPVKGVGLVVYSHLLDAKNSIFNRDAGAATYSATSWRVSHAQMRSQRQSCRGIRARHICIFQGMLAAEAAHPIDHRDGKEFTFELIRSWPGRRMSEIPARLGKRDQSLMGRNLDHLAVAGVIEPHEKGYMLTKGIGAELVELLPIGAKCGLSFEFISLLASVRHSVTHERSKRLLIRLAVLAGQVDGFLSRLEPIPMDEDNQTVSWGSMEGARQHIAGPARGEMSAGRLWFALGIWEKMRKDTHNLSVKMPGLVNESGEQDGDFHHIQGIGLFDSTIAVDVYVCVLELEDRVGLRLLAPSDPEWEEPLKVAELHEVQVQLMLAFMSNLAVWNVAAGGILLVSSRRLVALAPSSLVAHPHIANVDSRPRNGYLIIPDCIEEGNGKVLSALSASRVPLSLLRLITVITGEPAGDWLKWP